jgi:hypothetical protein
VESEAEGISPTWKGRTQGGVSIQIGFLPSLAALISPAGNNGVLSIAFLRAALLLLSKFRVALTFLPSWMWHQLSSSKWTLYASIWLSRPIRMTVPPIRLGASVDGGSSE